MAFKRLPPHQVWSAFRVYQALNAYNLFKKYNQRRGAAMVEFAFIAPIMFLLLTILLDVMQHLNTKALLANVSSNISNRVNAMCIQANKTSSNIDTNLLSATVKSSGFVNLAALNYLTDTSISVVLRTTVPLLSYAQGPLALANNSSVNYSIDIQLACRNTYIKLFSSKVAWHKVALLRSRSDIKIIA